jgi:hypothetical protein
VGTFVGALGSTGSPANPLRPPPAEKSTKNRRILTFHVSIFLKYKKSK